MARNLEELGALVILTPEAREPRRAAAQDRRDDRDAFDIVDGRRAAIKPRARRERRFQARLALLALEAFDHRGFFAADIGAGAAVDEDVEVVARLGGILRSEEHTSELQSLMRLSYAVFCLQKKNHTSPQQ